jgi:hypothetical protein
MSHCGKPDGDDLKMSASVAAEKFLRNTKLWRD